jgi:hypothetical protein
VAYSSDAKNARACNIHPSLTLEDQELTLIQGSCATKSGKYSPP